MPCPDSAVSQVVLCNPIILWGWFWNQKARYVFRLKHVFFATLWYMPCPDSAVSHAVLCNPTILWGDFELKKQSKFFQVKITCFFVTCIKRSPLGHTKRGLIRHVTS
jgi:hypothetical protein